MENKFLGSLAKMTRRKFIGYLLAGTLAVTGAGCGSTVPEWEDRPDSRFDISFSQPADGYEGKTVFNATVESEYPITSFQLHYRKNSEESWSKKNIVDGNVEVDLESAIWRAKVVANDSNGWDKTSNWYQFERWANKRNSKSEIESIFESLKQEGDIEDYFMNYTLEIEGMQIETDAAYMDYVHGLIVGWYVGENDNGNDDYKTALNDYGLPWFQINPCIKSELSDRIDEIRGNDWTENIVTSKADTEETKDKTLELFVQKYLKDKDIMYKRADIKRIDHEDKVIYLK
ncbi:hypothetical protein GF336_01580 [Candidatus Woesearchaeota archaeon]|nr:hypothetical protein [Candidatus Woesearchaeota archaeon]